MKNPLNKRLPRELKGEIGKYIVIFLLLIGTIGFVSGFLVADGSMITAYDESFEKYNIEDGHFTTKNKLNKAQLKAISQFDIELYDNYYVDTPLTNGNKMRIYASREDINKVCVMSGKLPTQDHEIAIDRMYAVNNELKIGDTISTKDQTYQITGLVALSDYSCLFENNNDSMFDSIKFGVSIVTEESFNQFHQDLITYNYSWKYKNPPQSERQEKEVSEDLLKDISQEVALEDFIPQYLNQAIQFTGEDMGSDRAMMIVLLYILIIIMAFVFGITTSNTISKEASVIGTLRASGYTKKELIKHYMTMPIVVTLIGALIGNILGYTLFKIMCVNMYYGSYSLPTYTTVWNLEAFIYTTIIPLILMIVINYAILSRKMKLSPLKFLRRDLKRKQQKHVFPLSLKLSFFSRFRLRVIFQNISNYVTLLIGILFANLLLFFGLVLPSLISDYQDKIETQLICQYQYMLSVPTDILSSNSKLDSLIAMLQFSYAVETENEDAEKFSAYALNTDFEEYKDEEIILYGINEESRYIPIDVHDDQVYISASYADKYLIDVGDTIHLKEKYEDKSYSFQVTGIYDYQGTLSVYMSQGKLNETFDLDKSYFSGYFSDSEITDIDQKYIGTTIDLNSLTKISRQLEVSMGNMMYLVQGIAIVIFMILIYLLSKIIIEKNAQSISMTKILGYNNKEISLLYIMSTSIMVILYEIITIPLVNIVVQLIYREMMIEMLTGWIPYIVDPIIFIKMFVLGMGTYAIVAFFEYRKVQKIPMDEALKNVE